MVSCSDLKKQAKRLVAEMAKESKYEWHKNQTRVVFEANAFLLLNAGVSERETFDTLDSLMIAMMGEYGE